ncbi:22826_t:CDS:2, partial [Gigaspora margarita]
YKKKLVLGLEWLGKIFIPRDKEEYKNQHIEWSREFLANNIGLLLERMNLSKNKTWDITLTVEFSRTERQRTKKKEKKKRKPKEKKKKTDNPKEEIEKKEKIEKDKTVKTILDGNTKYCEGRSIYID